MPANNKQNVFNYKPSHPQKETKNKHSKSKQHWPKPSFSRKRKKITNNPESVRCRMMTQSDRRILAHLWRRCFSSVGRPAEAYRKVAKGEKKNLTPDASDRNCSVRKRSQIEPHGGPFRTHLHKRSNPIRLEHFPATFTLDSRTKNSLSALALLCTEIFNLFWFSKMATLSDINTNTTSGPCWTDRTTDVGRECVGEGGRLASPDDSELGGWLSTLRWLRNVMFKLKGMVREAYTTS